MTVNTAAHKPVGTLRTGYAVAAAVNAVLLYLVNARPGWEALPFLTAETVHVLVMVNVSLAVGLAANLVYLVRPSSSLVPAGGIVTTGIGLAVLVRFWQVFPFDFGAGSWWTTVMRVLLILGIAGSIIAVPVQLVSLVRRVRHRR
ncbi:hypothetical protein [Actinoplanes solisilvae]|uniref:hypothetical protein n=1 Tax=Actinoplanes solisilvae TaxID=2486853 RepID=UPI00196A21FD|nr:hypothetical protein [Actinoplanes solisilvae]